MALRIHFATPTGTWNFTLDMRVAPELPDHPCFRLWAMLPVFMNTSPHPPFLLQRVLAHSLLLALKHVSFCCVLVSPLQR